MSQLNEVLVEDLPPGKMITFVTAVVDPSAASIELLSAGHGPLLLYTASDGKVQSLEAHGVPFGFAPGMPYGPAQDIAMAPGDMLVLSTDGFFEWENEKEEEFGLERLEETIRSAAELPPDQIITRMYEDVTAFAGGTHQADDVTAVVIKRSQD
jgi:serine phosphatase RsbU (regulator of sigma subunit)